MKSSDIQWPIRRNKWLAKAELDRGCFITFNLRYEQAEMFVMGWLSEQLTGWYIHYRPHRYRTSCLTDTSHDDLDGEWRLLGSILTSDRWLSTFRLTSDILGGLIVQWLEAGGSWQYPFVTLSIFLSSSLSIDPFSHWGKEWQLYCLVTTYLRGKLSLLPDPLEHYRTQYHSDWPRGPLCSGRLPRHSFYRLEAWCIPYLIHCEHLSVTGLHYSPPFSLWVGLRLTSVDYHQSGRLTGLSLCWYLCCSSESFIWRPYWWGHCDVVGKLRGLHTAHYYSTSKLWLINCPVTDLVHINHCYIIHLLSPLRSICYFVISDSQYTLGIVLQNKWADAVLLVGGDYSWCLRRIQ